MILGALMGSLVIHDKTLAEITQFSVVARTHLHTSLTTVSVTKVTPVLIVEDWPFESVVKTPLICYQLDSSFQIIHVNRKLRYMDYDVEPVYHAHRV